jgi:hypothetical protein
MNYAYLLAGGVSAFALVVHLMLGRARPLPAPRSNSPDALLLVDAWYGRHASTIALAVMAFSFAYASRAHGANDLAFAVSAMALLFACLRIGLALYARARGADMTQWGLIATAGLLGALGASG